MPNRQFGVSHEAISQKCAQYKLKDRPEKCVSQHFYVLNSVVLHKNKDEIYAIENPNWRKALGEEP